MAETPVTVETTTSVAGGVNLPGGTRIEGGAKGYRMGDIVMALAFLFAFVLKPIWDEYKGNEKAKVDVARMAEDHAQLISAVKKLTETNTQVDTRLGEVGFILTLDEEERKELNLSMPDSLRERTGWYDWKRRPAKKPVPGRVN